MDDNVVLVRFDDSSKAYQALSELKRPRRQGGSRCGQLRCWSAAATAACGCPKAPTTSTDSALRPGAARDARRVLSGPLGMLFGGSLGALAGSTADLSRAVDQDVAIDAMSKLIEPGRTVLVAEVGEVATDVVDNGLSSRMFVSFHDTDTGPARHHRQHPPTPILTTATGWGTSVSNSGQDQQVPSTAPRSRRRKTHL